MLDGQPSSVIFTEDGVWVAVAPDEVVLVDPDDLSITLSQAVGTGPRRSFGRSARSG